MGQHAFDLARRELGLTSIIGIIHVIVNGIRSIVKGRNAPLDTARATTITKFGAPLGGRSLRIRVLDVVIRFPATTLLREKSNI